ncbi:MAG: hypothetical protein SV422_08240 [Pseudomonadota bacterium]|nr:hypothetical protein [Pseudomonadota bacterium]
MLLATTSSAIAAILIFHGWRRSDAGWASAAGWLVALVSMFVWSWALGAEVGVCYALGVFACFVWAEIAMTADARKSVAAAVQRPFAAMQRPGVRAYLKHGALFLLSVPAAGVIAMMLSVALVLYLPWSLTLKFAVAIFLYPVVWGVLSVWICAQDKLLKPALVNLGLLAFSALLLFS